MMLALNLTLHPAIPASNGEPTPIFKPGMTPTEFNNVVIQNLSLITRRDDIAQLTGVELIKLVQRVINFLLQGVIAKPKSKSGIRMIFLVCLSIIGESVDSLLFVEGSYLLRIFEFLSAMRDVSRGFIHVRNFIELLLNETPPTPEFISFGVDNGLDLKYFKGEIRVSGKLRECLESVLRSHVMFHEPSEITTLICDLFLQVWKPKLTQCEINSHEEERENREMQQPQWFNCSRLSREIKPWEL